MEKEIKKGKKRAKIWLAVILLLLAYGGVMLGIGIYRVKGGDDNGASNLISGMFSLGVGGVSVYKICDTVANYASMEKDLERIEEQKKICEELEEMHRKMTGEG